MIWLVGLLEIYFICFNHFGVGFNVLICVFSISRAQFNFFWTKFEGRLRWLSHCLRYFLGHSFPLLGSLCYQLLGWISLNLPIDLVHHRLHNFPFPCPHYWYLQCILIWCHRVYCLPCITWYYICICCLCLWFIIHLHHKVHCWICTLLWRQVSCLHHQVCRV